MKSIAVIGAGGINSWSVKHLKELIDIYDLKREDMFIKIFDADIVEEKNIKRQNQNFNVGNLMFEKAEILGNRYNFAFSKIFITEENIDGELKPYDDIIIGVDNNKTRKLLYEFAIKNKKYLLDMKAQGTQIAYNVVDGSKDMDYYNEKYFANTEVLERKGSCQLASDIAKDHIENGNKIIAFLGIMGVYLKRLRNEQVTCKEYKFVY
jgi:molybdopterin/thiamine biosynthesis adenylyltransferase